MTVKFATITGFTVSNAVALAVNTVLAMGRSFPVKGQSGIRRSRFATPWLSLGLALAHSACAAAPGPKVTKAGSVLDGLDLSGPMIQFPPATGLPVQRPNAELAQDFLDLEFHLESGLALPVVTRFDGPVTVSMTGPVPATARADLGALIARLQTEAGLALTLLPDGSQASLTLAFTPSRLLHKIEPSAACFVIPNVASLAEYRAKRGSAALDWARMHSRSRATLFLPSDTSPQDLRDCLHEETAQALGPLNDLYRLPDSVFNDDNFQSVLTAFDMLMLRLHYAPELASGMTEAEVAAKLPALLTRLNPTGDGGSAWSARQTPPLWVASVARAVNPKTAPAARLTAANQSLGLALAAGWQDNRLGFAYFILGRVLTRRDPARAEAAFRAAAGVYQSLPDDGVHLSHALVQLCAMALAKGQDDQAIVLADQAIPLASRAQNAALLATLVQMKAEALAAQGHVTEAAALRLDSLPAARYGFGTVPQVRAHAAEIAAIARMSQHG